MASSWESRDYSFLLGAVAPADSDDSDIEDLSEAESSAEFMNFLVHLKMTGVLAAKAVCILSFWAKRGGLISPGDALALSPHRTGGAFSAHFDKVIGIDVAMRENWYMLDVPGHSKHDVSRCIKKVAVKPAHESLADELAETVGIMQLLADRVRTEEWADNFLEHEHVKLHGPENVIPIGLYVDGVQYQRRNNTIGFWCVNLITQRRHLMVVLQKRDLCRCGCKGYCSLFPALAFIEWTIAAMVDGRYPTVRHDRPWVPADTGFAVAGDSLGYIAVPVLFKGDWAEFAGTMGFRSWAHHGHPCFRCCATGGPHGTIKVVEGISVVDLPWAKKTQESFEQACQACEFKIIVADATDLAVITGQLKYDKRRTGSFGRALVNDIHRFGLNKGDRLEPSHTAPDVANIDIRSDFPFELTFWRVANETATRHRCPLFTRRSYICPEILCVDEMHTMHLGIFQDFILAVFWQAFDADVWGVHGHLPEEAYLAQASLLLRADLFVWYRQQRLDFPDRPLHEMADLQLTMLGSRDRKALHAKAAESGTLMYFAFDMAVRHSAVLAGGSALVDCGRGLVQYMEVTRSSSLRLSVAARQGLAEGIVRFLVYRHDAGVEWKPKAHLSSHIVQDGGHFGNPLCTGTWLDEGLNCQLAAVCRSAHSAVWSQRVLASFGHKAGPAARAATVARQKKRIRS
jgi:hypothetical protein